MQKKNKFLGVLAIICLCLETVACGKKLQDIGIGGNTGNSEEYVYEKNVTMVEKAVLSEAVPFSFFLSGKFLYFCEKESYDGEDASETYIIKRIPVENGNVSEKVLSVPMGFLCYSVQNADGNDIICIVGENDDGRFITEYESATKTEKTVPVAKVNNSHRPNLIAKSGENYAVVCGDKCDIVDKEGKTIATFESPGDDFYHIAASEDGAVYATYRRGNDLCLGSFDISAKKVQSEIIVPYVIKRICYDDGKVLMTDGKKVLACNVEKGEISQIVDLFSYDLSLTDVDCFIGSSESFTLFGKNYVSQDTREVLIQMSKTDKRVEIGNADVDPLGKRIIRLYSPNDELRKIAVPDELILEFNQNSNEYRVEIIESQNRGGIDMTSESEITPDVILIYWCNDVEKYANNGYLADLWPLIRKSSNIDIDDIHKCVTQNFEYGGKLYAFPMYLSAYTVMLKDSAAKGKKGWTPAEFLDWLENHRDVYFNFFAGKREILNCCIDGALESYVNFETGKVSFEGTDFREILEKIKRLNLEHADEYIITNPFIRDAFDSKGKTILFISLLSDLNAYAQFEIMEGEKTVNLGLPSENREGKAISRPYSNLAIYEKSRCKEGAMAFIEYCLRHGNDMFSEHELVPKGRVASLYSEQRRGFKALIGTYKDYAEGMDYTVTADQANRLAAIFDNAIPDSKEREDIRAIIEEEAQLFFDGVADIEDTVRKIQSRVSILVEERR